MINYTVVAKKYLFDILQERYQSNEPIISRMTHYLTSEKDVKDFCQIAADAFSKGYSKAVEDYKEQLSKLGYKATLK